MVHRGAIIENLQKLEDMVYFIDMLMNLHKTALFTWKIDGTDFYLEQAKIDAIITRYKTLKTQLATKYEGLL